MTLLCLPADDLLDEVTRLAMLCLSGDADVNDIARLDDLLCNSDEACRTYVRIMFDSSSLRRWSGAERPTSEEKLTPRQLLTLAGDCLADEVDCADDLPREWRHVQTPGLLSTALRGTIGYFSHEIPFSFLIGTVLTSLLVLVAWLVPVSKPVEIADHKSSMPSVAQGQFNPGSKMEIVGEITGMVDCKWEKGSRFRIQGSTTANHQSLIPNLQSLVALGDKYALTSGLMEITYNKGAKVILQGPCTYEVDSRDGGFLKVGKLTARLEKSGEGRGETKEKRSEASGQGAVTSESDPKSQNPEIPTPPISNPQSLIPNPLFAVRTPTATITDLGTEFGIEVSKEGHTTSHVFRGSVQLQAVSADGKVEGDAQILHENQSARIEKHSGDQVDSHRIAMFVTPAKSAGFVREIPHHQSKPTIKTFDLVDVVAGGDGFSGRRMAGIDPTTGRRISESEYVKKTEEYYKGDNQYHRSTASKFIDGVFIPNSIAGPVQVDSAGHTFSDLVTAENATVRPVWAGGRVPSRESYLAVNPSFVVRTELGGVDYASPEHRLLYLHANIGITFDFQAIRQACSMSKIVRFCSTVGNTELDSEKYGSPVYVDVWVLVDGQVRFRRREINNYTGAFSVAVPIHDGDRFLTLISSDSGNGIAGDWILFGDPRLEMTVLQDVEKASSSKIP